MKRLMFSTIILFTLSIPVYAHMGGAMMGEQKSESQQEIRCEEMMMPMMGQGMMQCCPKMPMMGQGMMMRDMMQMMKDMMKMQKEMIEGVKPTERKEMMKEMDKMMDRMDEMMSDMRGMMMRGVMGGPPVKPKKEEREKEELQKEETPKTDPHGH